MPSAPEAALRRGGAEGCHPLDDRAQRKWQEHHREGARGRACAPRQEARVPTGRGQHPHGTQPGSRCVIVFCDLVCWLVRVVVCHWLVVPVRSDLIGRLFGP